MISSIKRRVKELESKITDLESETDRLSQALDSQKVLTTEVQAALVKEHAETTRELQKKVNCILCPSGGFR